MNWSDFKGMYNTTSTMYSMNNSTSATSTLYNVVANYQAQRETDGPDDDGSAGVREPRKPRPTAPAGAMAIDYEEVST